MNTIRLCPKCRQPLPADAPEGLCPACLLSPGSSFANPPKPGPDSYAEPPQFQTQELAPGTRLGYVGDYELLEEIARGGMGVVYRARQSSLKRIVAVKMIRSGELAGDAEVKRFRAEAEAAANLKHPNIVAIHEIGEHEGRHYFSMDLVEGKNLAQFTEGKPVAARQAAEWLKAIAEAVQFAHQRGVLHRDLKPQNILVDAEGRPHVTDFGLAKNMQADSGVTQTGAVMGSPSYMAPEQARGRNDLVGPASDVYSLGAVLYELLTGRAPFTAETPLETLRKVVGEEPTQPSKLNPDTPPDLETICLKCLEKEPTRRYPTARALAEDVGLFLNGEPILAKPASVARKAVSWCRQRPWVLMGITTLLFLALLAVSYGLWERVQFLDWKAHPHGPQEAWPELGKSSLLLSLLFIPFVLSLFFAATYKEIPRSDGWGYRFHFGFLALTGGCSVASGLFLTLFHIHFLVWQQHPAWGQIIPAFMSGPIPFTWAGATLLWRLASRSYVHQLGITPPASTPTSRVHLGKLFWSLLGAEAIVIFLASFLVVTRGQYSPWPDSTSAAKWDEALRNFFIMIAWVAAFIPFCLTIGFRKLGNARWGCFFAAGFLVLGLFHMVRSTWWMIKDHPTSEGERFKLLVICGIVAGLAASGSLIWAALFRKTR